MTPRHERPATSLMQDYWNAQHARGEKLRPVLGLVALKGAHQPAGYVICWGLLPSYVEAVQARQPDPDKWEIKTFQPTGVAA